MSTKNGKGKKKAIRRRKWDEKYIKMAEVACAKGGFTDELLAQLFGVGRSTIANWKKKYPEFDEALRAGKESFDTDCVETALLKVSKGYQYTEITQELRQGKGEFQDHEPVLVTTKKVIKDIKPDTGAICFWLKNRRPERWSDRKDVNFSGVIGLREALDEAEGTGRPPTLKQQENEQ